MAWIRFQMGTDSRWRQFNHQSVHRIKTNHPLRFENEIDREINYGA